MVEQARAKLTAAGLEGRFLVGDVAVPPTGDELFDVLTRHLLSTLPDPEAALHEWTVRRLVSDLRVEALWATLPCGAGR